MKYHKWLVKGANDLAIGTGTTGTYEQAIDAVTTCLRDSPFVRQATTVGQGLTIQIQEKGA